MNSLNFSSEQIELKKNLQDIFCKDDTFDEKLQDRQFAAKGEISYLSKFFRLIKMILAQPPQLLPQLLYEASGFYLSHDEDTPEEREFTPEEYRHWFQHTIYLPMLRLFVDRLKEKGYSDEKITQTLGFDWQAQFSS